MGIFSAAWKMTGGSAVGRVFGGALAGGIYGGATSESNLGENTAGRALGGALMGAGLGMGINAAGMIGKKAINAASVIGKKASTSQGFNKMYDQGIDKVYNFVPSATSKGVGMGMGTLRLAMRNPGVIAGAGLGGLGLYSLANSGYGDTNANEEAMNAMAVQRGTNSALSGGSMNYLHQSQGFRSLSGKALHASTEGLVQGLHTGRHR